MSESKEMTTQLRYHVFDENNQKRTYQGFVEITSLNRLKDKHEVGLILVQDEVVTRIYMYDKTYINAIAEFYRYWRETFPNSLYIPPHKIIDFRIIATQTDNALKATK